MCHGKLLDDWTQKEAEMTEISQKEELERSDMWQEPAPEPAPEPVGPGHAPALELDEREKELTHA